MLTYEIITGISPLISKYCLNDKVFVDVKGATLEKYFADSIKTFSGCLPSSSRTSKV